MFKNLNKYSDKELHILVKTNNKRNTAFEVIFERYSNFTIAYIRGLVKNEDLAKELFQESFVRLYNILLEKEDVNIPGMLTTISKNLFFNYNRDKKNKIDIQSINLEFADDNDIEKKELLDLILNSVEFLEEKYRTVFLLREFKGLSFKEIAEQENISVANAKLRATRAKRKLIKILKPYIIDLEKI